MTASCAAKLVLVIDDDDGIREGISELLVDEGYAVEVASNGREGLDRLHRMAEPCVILLDLMMPVLDGYGFLEEKTRDPRLAHVPVVVLTAGEFARGGVRPEAVLSKPVRVPVLMAEIEKRC